MDLYIAAGPSKAKLERLSKRFRPRRISLPLDRLFSIMETDANEQSPPLDLELLAEDYSPIDKEGRYWALEGSCIGERGITPFNGLFDSGNRVGYLYLREQ